MSDEAKAGAVARALGHTFKRKEHLRDALTHRSYANEHPDRAPHDNERLEFLGDAIVGMAVSSILWDSFPPPPRGS